jgi:molybdopterin synthase sulfur carrier subunit
MIRALFFAKLREQVGSSNLQLEFVAGESLQALRERIASQDGFDAVLADNIIVAVNQTVSDWHVTVADGDEVAFFPPVTGG